MFNIGNIIARRLSGKIDDKLEDVGSVGNLLDDPSQIGGMIKDRIMQRPAIAAGTMDDDEYLEYLRAMMMSGDEPFMAQMPSLQMSTAPFLSPGGLSGQSNYLNFAQQTFGGGGPY